MSTASFYRQGLYHLTRTDLERDDLRVLLVGREYRFDPSHGTRDDVELAEVVGAGYSAGGQTIPGRRQTWLDDGSSTLFGDNVHWAKFPAQAKVRGAIIYRYSHGKPWDDPLLCYHDYVEDVSGEPFTVEWGPDGIFTFAPTPTPPAPPPSPPPPPLAEAGEQLRVQALVRIPRRLAVAMGWATLPDDAAAADEALELAAVLGLCNIGLLADEQPVAEVTPCDR